MSLNQPPPPLSVAHSVKEVFDVSSELSNEIAKWGRLVPLHQGENIVLQGTPFDGQLLILSGLTASYFMDLDGVERLVGLTSSGKMMFPQRPNRNAINNARVEVLEAGWGLQLTQSAYDNITSDYPELYQVYIDLLSDMTLIVGYVAFQSHSRDKTKKIGETLASLMLYLNRNSLPISIKDFATLLGMSRNTTSQALRPFLKAGVLEYTDEKLYAEDPQLLRIDPADEMQ